MHGYVRLNNPRRWIRQDALDGLQKLELRADLVIFCFVPLMRARQSQNCR
jgi:hypothetical protein